jgi:arginine decarboxylase
MAEAVQTRGYNSLSQFRADAWCGLEEASERLGAAAAAGRPVDMPVERVTVLLDQLAPIERYWAYPGPLAFQQGRCPSP